MSANNQNISGSGLTNNVANSMGGGKKGSATSSNSSMANTPASTPITNGQITSPPPNNNAPKYGTLVPNRIFVGGISANTTEGELLQLFSSYGTVKAAKIIQDRAGVSKGYGFITFESEDDAKRLQREADNIVLRERKLNIAPAIKKQSFSRTFDASSPPAVAAGNPQYFFQPGAMPYFQGGVAYYPQPPTGPADPAAQQPNVYQPPSVYPPQSAPPQTAAAYQPVIYQTQPIYMPQQYPMHVPYDYGYYPSGGAQYMVGGQGGSQSQMPPGAAAAAAAAAAMQQQRANSPPGGGGGPPCYGQQLPPPLPPPYAGTPDGTVYYNVPPIYGGPIDGGPVYTADPTAAGMDVVSMPNGNISEDFEGASRQQQPQTQPQQQPIASNGEKDCSVDNSSKSENSDARSIRLSSNVTPVVSLLTLDQHQEKDLVSMQSGRRRKPVVSSNVHNNQFYPPPPQQQHQQQHHHQQQQQQQHHNYPHNGYQSFAPHHHPQAYYPFSTMYDKVNTRKWRKSDSCSVRTDSNSSASVVDENRNEEKFTTTPSSNNPISTHLVNYKYYNSRNYSNNVHPASNQQRRLGPSSQTIHTSKPPSYAKNHPSKMPSSVVPQMHAGSQHFVPPSRRNRRNVRRNGSSAIGGEIGGAGDAPLPNSDVVSETCTKLDGLKL